MSGHPTAITQGLESLQNGSTAALLGIPADDISIDISKTIIFKGVTVLGINGRKMFETWYQMERYLLSGIDLDPIVTHVIPMEQFETGFKKMQSAEAIKVILEMPDV
jgi:threonine 3-dehydrogenase